MLKFEVLRNEAGEGEGGGGGLMASAVAEPPVNNPPAPAEGEAKTPPAQVEAPAGILNDEGGLNAEWYKGGDAEQYGKQLDKFNTVEGLAKGYALLEKNRMVPSDGSDEAAIAAFRAANNIPTTHEEYDIQVPENLPLGVELDDNSIAQYKEVFHQANITPHQAQKLFDAHLAQVGEQVGLMTAEQHTRQQEQSADLKREWGNSYEASLQSAQNAFDHLCTQAGVDSSKVSFTGDPLFAKIMSAAASLTSEAPVKGIGGSAPSLQGGKQEAQNIMTNVNHADYKAFHDISDPRHNEVQDRVAQINR